MPPSSAFLFVTGSTSPVGRRVLRFLLAKDWNLRCLLRSPNPELEALSPGRLTSVGGNLEDPAPWEHALEGAHAVIHLAPIALVPPVVDAALRRDVRRLIALSSTRLFTRFEDPLLAGIERGEAALEASPLHYTLLRPAMIYGAGPDANVDRLVRWLDRRSWLPLIGGGRGRVQPVHADDVADAVLRCLERPVETDRLALTLAGPQPMTWRAMAEAVAKNRGVRLRWIPVPRVLAVAGAACLDALPRRRRSYGGMISRLFEDRAFDISATSTALAGWRPADFSTGLERTYGAAVSSGGMASDRIR